MSSLSGKQGPRYRHLAGETEPFETIGVEKLPRSLAPRFPVSIWPGRCRTGPWTKSIARSPKIS